MALLNGLERLTQVIRKVRGEHAFLRAIGGGCGKIAGKTVTRRLSPAELAEYQADGPVGSLS